MDNMSTNIPPIEEHVCGSEEGSSSMDHNYPFKQLPALMQSHGPLCVTNDDCFTSLIVPDILEADSLVDAFTSVSISESLWLESNGAKGNVRCDDGSGTTCPETICQSPQRKSTCTRKLKQKTMKKTVVKRCGKLPNKKQLLDVMLLTVARRNRSGNRGRSSAWGCLGNISEVFEQNTNLEFSQVELEKSFKTRKSRGSGKKIKNLIDRSSQKSKGKGSVSTGPIRLRVKLGSEMINSCLENVTPGIGNDVQKYWETKIKTPKLTEDEKKLDKELPRCMEFHCHNENLEQGIMLSNTPSVDVHLADKGISEGLTRSTMDNSHEIPFQEDMGRLAITHDNGCFDPGTSPDSEVINVIPDTRASGNIPDDLHFVVSSRGCVAHEDFTTSNLPQTSCKKGKKKGKSHQLGKCNLKGRSSNNESIDNATMFGNHVPRRKKGDGSYSSEASIITMAGNTSGNTYTHEGISMQSLPSSRSSGVGNPSETLIVGGGKADICSGLGVGFESSESGLSEKLHPSTSKGQKLPKSSRAKPLRKNRSKVPDSANKIKKACRQKGNLAKSASKQEAKEKGNGCEVSSKVNCLTAQLGKQTLVKVEEIKSGSKSTNGDISNDLVLRGVGGQYLPPRNAWVRCDDCHKWRRITAALADSIEETNCKWICKDSMDKDFADCSIPQEKSNAEINAELEISDGSGEEDARGNAFLNGNRSGGKKSAVSQQSSWMLIKSNLFLHRSRKSQTIDEIMVCHCKPPSDGRMGCTDGCLNRMLNIECVRGTCPCGDLCSNQQFQKRKYSRLKWYRCGKKGYGLQLLEDISQGQFLIEYVGEVLDMRAYEARQKDYAFNGHEHFYFMTLNGSEVIDACAKGNLGRFINHSCDPNCRTEKWMVNGEVCIGLFALRDIKKGEEVTFDYNYVRVFGAAAKKCLCGSSHCRGYIGGDPLNSEVIVQNDSDDEFPEPVMVCEDGAPVDNLDEIIFATKSFNETAVQTAENQLKHEDNMDKHATAATEWETQTEKEPVELLEKGRDELDNSTAANENLLVPAENEDSTSKFVLPDFKMEMSEHPVLSSVQPVNTSQNPAGITSKTMTASQSLEDTSKNTSLYTIQNTEICSQSTTPSKLLPDSTDAKKKPVPEIEEDRLKFSKANPLMKISRSSSSVKKGKSKTAVTNVSSPLEADIKLHLQPFKTEKPLEFSLNGRFEAVQEKLNELLDADGGISKRKDASRGYLKLLLLTAASGDSDTGETIQSNRDLSMILGALLKTKSRTVLIDVINKNGLQMLHNIMKRYRKEFNKIPILRKLLKVLEYLAVKEILSHEQINGGPPCPGVESFRESILTLTEHTDKQVHQIARNFRDRWIPRHLRKSICMERDDGRMEFNRGSNCNRFSSTRNHLCDQAARPIESMDCVKASGVASSTDANVLDGCSASSSSCITNGTKVRKRKSRWDQPAEKDLDPRSPQNKEPRIHPNLAQKPCFSPSQDERQNINEDVPPGFSPLLSGPLIPAEASYQLQPCDVVMGHLQGRFSSRLSLSYGIPLSVVQQFGTSQPENVDNWVVAPGMSFHPFPPLPPYPRDMDPPCGATKLVTGQSTERDGPGNCDPFHHSDENTASTSGASISNVPVGDASNQNNFQQPRSSTSGNLGRKYFRQQKWNNSKLVPPWIRNRNGWEATGNNPRNDMCNVGGVGSGFKGPSYSSEGVRNAVENSGNDFYHHSFPQH